MRRLFSLLGPALVAGVAYLDPGNVASNISAGAKFGFLLLWVVVLGNLIAWLVQYLSAKLGIVTGKSLPQLIGERITNKWGRRAFWVQAELVAMATDLAEVLGGAIALYLLFGIPLVWGGLITGALSIALLALHSRAGGKIFERVIIGMLVITAVGFFIGVVVSPPHPGEMVAGLLPGFDGVTFGIHLCRGNPRTRDPATGKIVAQWHREGHYDAIAEQVFGDLMHDRFLLEYDTERSGGFEPLKYLARGKVAVLGLVTTKDEAIEPADYLIQRIEAAAQHLPLEQLALSPQCGFGGVDPLNPTLSETVQWKKFERIVEVANAVWGN